MSRVRFSLLPDFLNSSASGTESTQLQEDKWRVSWTKSSGTGLENRLTPVGVPPRWPRDTPLYIKIRRQVAVPQSVHLACGLKATEFYLDSCGRTSRETPASAFPVSILSVTAGKVLVSKEVVLRYRGRVLKEAGFQRSSVFVSAGAPPPHAFRNTWGYL
jgi:hypothetical protein